MISESRDPHETSEEPMMTGAKFVDFFVEETPLSAHDIDAYREDVVIVLDGDVRLYSRRPNDTYGIVGSWFIDCSVHGYSIACAPVGSGYESCSCLKGAVLASITKTPFSEIGVVSLSFIKGSSLIQVYPSIDDEGNGPATILVTMTKKDLGT